MCPRKLILKRCEFPFCTNEFLTNNDKKYCHEHRNSYQRKIIIKNCAICDATFQTESKNRLYCDIHKNYLSGRHYNNSPKEKAKCRRCSEIINSHRSYCEKCKMLRHQLSQNAPRLLVRAGLIPVWFQNGNCWVYQSREMAEKNRLLGKDCAFREAQAILDEPQEDDSNV